jgi:hypothetical protein
MSSHTESIEISHETARLICAEAEARQVAINDYLRSLAEGSSDRELEVGLSLIEIEGILAELAFGSENLPPLPSNFSREDIYYDHDQSKPRVGLSSVAQTEQRKTLRLCAFAGNLSDHRCDR